MKKYFINIIFLLTLENVNGQNIDLRILKNINTPGEKSGLWINATKTTYPIVAGIHVGMLLNDYNESDSLRSSIPILLAEKLAVIAAIDGLKYIVNRNRPYTDYPNIIYPYDKSEISNSFPSGHTSMAFYTAASLSMKYPKWYVVAPSYLWASMVGYSRLNLGEHYPSDVIVGALLGVGCAYIEKWVDKKLFVRRKKHF